MTSKTHTLSLYWIKNLESPSGCSRKLSSVGRAFKLDRLSTFLILAREELSLMLFLNTVPWLKNLPVRGRNIGWMNLIFRYICWRILRRKELPANLLIINLGSLLIIVQLLRGPNEKRDLHICFWKQNDQSIISVATAAKMS